jgi:hypothetical protein
MERGGNPTVTENMCDMCGLKTAEAFCKQCGRICLECANEDDPCDLEKDPQERIAELEAEVERLTEIKDNTMTELTRLVVGEIITQSRAAEIMGISLDEFRGQDRHYKTRADLLMDKAVLKAQLTEAQASNRQLVEALEAIKADCDAIAHSSKLTLDDGDLSLFVEKALSTPTAKRAQAEARVLDAAKALQEAGPMHHGDRCPLPRGWPENCECGLSNFEWAVEALQAEEGV